LVVLVLFTLQALFPGITKLFGVAFMVEQMAGLGYSKLFTHFLGLCWVLAAIGVWFKKTRSLAALLVIPIMSGAIAAHWTKGDGFFPLLLIPIVLALLIMYLDGFHKRILPPA